MTNDYNDVPVEEAVRAAPGRAYRVSRTLGRPTALGSRNSKLQTRVVLKSLISVDRRADYPDLLGQLE
jgi:hypothetical protein